jgi:hypothetical protein
MREEEKKVIISYLFYKIEIVLREKYFSLALSLSPKECNAL